MFPMCKSISIIAEGNTKIIERYAILAAALSEAGYRVRFLSHIEHQVLFEKISGGGTSTTFVPMKRNHYKDPDFIALMKNMNPELQKLVINDPRLQVAMAKCDSDQFIKLTKSMIESREMCSSVLDDLVARHCEPDLIIAGHQCEYFGIYFKQMRNIPCINLSVSVEPKPSFLRQGNQQQLTRWTNLDNSMASLGLPRILSNSPGALKVNKMTVIDELQRIHCLPLEINEEDLVNAVVEATSTERIITYEHYPDAHADVAKTDMLLSATNQTAAACSMA